MQASRNHVVGVETFGLAIIYRFQASDVPINSAALNVLAQFPNLPYF